jgi:hypothetical protein
MAAVSFGYSCHQPAERCLRQPVRHAPAKDSVPQRSLAGDDERAAHPAAGAILQKVDELGARLVLLEAMQVYAIAEQAARETPKPARLDALRLCRGRLATGRWFRQGSGVSAGLRR